jgi:predicted nuclease with TOPRIM domain
MAEVSDETKVSVPIRNLIGLGAGIVMATTAYVTLNSRITTLEHGHEMQAMTIKENTAFVREWPLGLRGALPDDLIQNAKIMALEEKNAELKELREEIRRLQLDLGQVNAKTETQEEKIETLFDIWNNQITKQ